MREQEREALSVGAATSSVARDGFLAACREVERQGLPALIEELFTKVDDSLYDLADKATNNTSYTAYFDAVRLLRRHRGRVSSRLLELLERAPGGGPGTRPAPSGLRLMGEAELEESLVLTNLISKAETRYRAELAGLRRYLANLSGGEPIEPQADPLGPQAICEAFRSAMKVVEDLDPAIKLVVYKVFDQQVMDHLGPIYRRCLGLVPGDVLDDGPWRRPPHPDRPSRAPGEPPLGPSPAGRALPGTPPGFDGLRRLLRRPETQGPAQAPRVATGDVLATLTHLQGDGLPDSDPRHAVAALRERVRRELRLASGAKGRVLDARDEDALDLVFLLFEGILAANDLPDVFKALISRLQIPVLKVALADPSFFDDARHPARSLLNHLAEAAVGWSPQVDEDSAELYRLITQIVEEIVHDFDRDIALLRRLDARLVAYLEQERRQAEARLSQALGGLTSREQDRSAQHAVARTITARMRAQARVPGPVAALIQDGWRQVLLAAYQRGGEGSDDWREALTTLDRLLWSVQPKVDQDDRRELLRAIPGLLRNLRESLAKLSYDPRRLSQSFKELQALHMVALRGTQGAQDERSFRAAPAPWLRAVPETEVELAPAPLGAPARLPSGLVAGGWIELRRAGSVPRRMRLAGQSPAGILLLVDRSGRQVLELEGAELADMITEGSALVLGPLEETPLVDRTLTAVARALAKR